MLQDERSSAHVRNSFSKSVSSDIMKTAPDKPRRFWQREKDSNPHIRSQSPLCYLYTIPLNAKVIITKISDLSRPKTVFFGFQQNRVQTCRRHV